MQTLLAFRRRSSGMPLIQLVLLRDRGMVGIVDRLLRVLPLGGVGRGLQRVLAGFELGVHAFELGRHRDELRCGSARRFLGLVRAQLGSRGPRVCGLGLARGTDRDLRERDAAAHRERGHGDHPAGPATPRLLAPKLELVNLALQSELGLVTRSLGGLAVLEPQPRFALGGGAGGLEREQRGSLLPNPRRHRVLGRSGVRASSLEDR